MQFEDLTCGIASPFLVKQRTSNRGWEEGFDKVDASDLVDLNKACGCTFGLSAWDANCDVNGDNKVNVLDLFIQGKNYGRTDP